MHSQRERRSQKKIVFIVRMLQRMGSKIRYSNRSTIKKIAEFLEILTVQSKTINKHSENILMFGISDQFIIKVSMFF